MLAIIAGKPENDMKKLSVILTAICLTLALSAPAVFAADGGKRNKQERAKQKEELLKKYDKNGDGKLDATERAAMRQDLKKDRKQHSKPGTESDKTADKTTK
ncbi:MAG: hypothetical protein DME26_21195 [Verrucomicrobia bacterium]|nr:MAG: hypothetical protein DME26_21195 [Verrucomicrobiota bacterium]